MAEFYGAILMALMIASVMGMIAQSVYDEWVRISSLPDDEEDEDDKTQSMFVIDMEKKVSPGDLCWDESVQHTCIFFGECLGEDNNIYAAVGFFLPGRIYLCTTLPSALHCVKR